MIQYRGETIELFTEKEIIYITKEIENLFKEELKNDEQFIKIIPHKDEYINILFKKVFTDGIYKSIFKLSKQYNEQTKKFHIVGSLENLDITKNNIEKISNRLRWILEMSNKCLNETWTDKFFRKLGKGVILDKNGNEMVITYNGSYLVIIEGKDTPEIRLNDDYEYDLVVSNYDMIGTRIMKNVEYIIKQIKNIMKEGE